MIVSICIITEKEYHYKLVQKYKETDGRRGNYGITIAVNAVSGNKWIDLLL
jgi:hypothetical protein